MRSTCRLRRSRRIFLMWQTGGLLSILGEHCWQGT